MDKLHYLKQLFKIID